MSLGSRTEVHNRRSLSADAQFSGKYKMSKKKNMYFSLGKRDAYEVFIRETTEEKI